MMISRWRRLVTASAVGAAMVLMIFSSVMGAIVLTAVYPVKSIDSAGTLNSVKAVNSATANSWATIQLLALPTVDTTGVSGISTGQATVAGTVSITGGSNPTVTLFYGQTDGGTTAATWENSAAPFTPAQPQGAAAFQSLANTLEHGTTYYYRARATNAKGDAWSSATGSFTTDAYAGLRSFGVIVPLLVLLAFGLGAFKLIAVGINTIRIDDRRATGILQIGIAIALIGVALLIFFPAMLEALGVFV